MNLLHTLGDYLGYYMYNYSLENDNRYLPQALHYSSETALITAEGMAVKPYTAADMLLRKVTSRLLKLFRGAQNLIEQISQC